MAACLGPMFCLTGGSIRFAPIVRQLAVGIVAACTVVFTASQVHPVFLGQAPVAGRVLAAAYLDSASIRAPWLSLPEALAMRHPQFQRDVDAFASDLRGTGKIDPSRADSIAAVAVREAYHRRIPPALVLGVMLTENDRFKSHARSNVGAMGLMQIMPRLWTPNLGPILGKNLKDDETNVRYGVYILKHFAKRTADSLDAGDVTRIALLNYNGCVRGSNTPDCRAYPIKVQRHVENSARESCSGRAFKECVSLPLWAGLRDTTPPPMPGASLASTIPAASMDRVHSAPRTTPLSTRLGHWLGGAN
ncbi:MAG: Lytic transglycosylase catalytic [Gemmatimonadetes bacterium]|nr:Lytic transglycosylase catalytic [Gemmatimonadota bacterium]